MLHEITINDYNRYVFIDSVDAYTCYKLLTEKAHYIETIYTQRPDGTTDYDNPVQKMVTPEVSLQVYNDKS